MSCEDDARFPAAEHAPRHPGWSRPVRRVRERERERHHASVLPVPREEHAHHPGELPAVLDEIRAREGQPHAATFPLDHDDPVFGEALLASAERARSRHAGSACLAAPAASSVGPAGP